MVSRLLRPLVLAGSALTYLGSALALTGFVRERLSYGRTVLAQLAASFTGFVIPDRFVIGYGLDYAGLYRELRGIYYLS